MSERTLLTSAARTADTASTDQSDINAEGVHVIIRVTALSATPQVTPRIQGKDPASGAYYDVLVGSVITDVTVGTPPALVVLKLAPGITAQPNAAAADFLPDTWRVFMGHGDADSITYTVGAVLAE
jgi:hypothetical protein